MADEWGRRRAEMAGRLGVDHALAGEGAAAEATRAVAPMWNRQRLEAVGVGRLAAKDESMGKGDEAEAVLRKAKGSVRFLVMHERGEPLSPELLGEIAPASNSSSVGEAFLEPSTVLVLGDHLGFTQEEEQCLELMGGVRANVSPLPLLASHCIVLAHAVLDRVAMGADGPREDS